MYEKQKVTGIRACVFDAYGTLFDVHSAVARYRDCFAAGTAESVSALWRTKQLEYTWLRSLMGSHADFWQVTQDALDFALDMYRVELPELRNKLMDAYLQLKCYPEVPETLSTLKKSGVRLAILSNGTPSMLDAAIRNSRLEEFIEHSYSVEEAGVFKPDPRVYRLAVDGLGVKPEDILFHSSNAWDACGAAFFGCRVAWINRFGQSRERLPGTADIEVTTLDAIPERMELG